MQNIALSQIHRPKYSQIHKLFAEWILQTNTLFYIREYLNERKQSSPDRRGEERFDVNNPHIGDMYYKESDHKAKKHALFA